MGGDRRSPPHHRGRGGGGGRGRSARGGASFSCSNGGFDQSLSLKNGISASKKLSGLKKESVIKCVNQGADLEEECIIGAENGDFCNQDCNNSADNNKDNQHSQECKGNSEGAIQISGLANSEDNMQIPNGIIEDNILNDGKNAGPMDFLVQDPIGINQDNDDARRSMETIIEPAKHGNSIEMAGMNYSVHNPMFWVEDKVLDMETDCNMLSNEILVEGNEFPTMNERNDRLDLGKNLTINGPNTSMGNDCMEGVCCNDPLVPMGAGTSLKEGFGPLEIGKFGSSKGNGDLVVTQGDDSDKCIEGIGGDTVGIVKSAMEMQDSIVSDKVRSDTAPYSATMTIMEVTCKDVLTREMATEDMAGGNSLPLKGLNNMETDEIPDQGVHPNQFQGMTFCLSNPMFWDGESVKKIEGECPMRCLNEEEVGLNVNGDQGMDWVQDRERRELAFGSDFQEKEICSDDVCINPPTYKFDLHVNSPAGDRGTEESSLSKGKNVHNDHVRLNRERPNAWKKPEHVQIEWNNRGKATSDGKFVNLNMEAVNHNQSRLQKALVGKLVGKRLPFNILSNELRKRWEPFGEFQFLMMGEETFTCVFHSAEARDAVLLGGPWLVGGYIVGLDKWTPSFAQDSMKGLSAPIWIRFPNLPLLYWDNDNLARIASMVGDPLWIDAQTSIQGRCSYARMCVRLNLDQKLPTGVWIHGIEGNFFQKVEYEGLHQVCFKCGHIGHKENACQMFESGTFTAGNSNVVHQSTNIDLNIRRGEVGGNVKKSTFGWNKGETLILEKTKGSSGVSSSATDASLTDKGGCTKGVEIGESTCVEECGITDASMDNDDGNYGPWIYVTRRKGSNTYKNSGKQNSKTGFLNARSGQNKQVVSFRQRMDRDTDRNTSIPENEVQKVNKIQSENKLLINAKGKEVITSELQLNPVGVQQSPRMAFTAERKYPIIPSNGKRIGVTKCSNGADCSNWAIAKGNFSAFREDEGPSQGDGISKNSGRNARRDRGSCRVPSLKEISYLGPITSGSRKKRKGDDVLDDCLGHKDDCGVIATDSEFGVKEDITNCGGDASPLRD